MRRNHRATTRDLARTIAAPDSTAKLRLRQGTVSAVSTTTGTATVTLGAGTTPIPGVRYLVDAVPAVSDTVWLLRNGPDLLIIGVQDNGPGTWTPGVSGGTWALGNGTASGIYQRSGRYVLIDGIITFGSTSVFGGGAALTLTGLPIAPRAGFNGYLELHFFVGAGAGQSYGRWRIPATTTTGAALYAGNIGAGSNLMIAVDNTHPGTWQAANTIEIYGRYPI